jgi:hypothetical protein
MTAQLLPSTVILPRWHHDNPVRRVERIQSLDRIRQRHSARHTWSEHWVDHYPPTVVVSDKYQMFGFDAPRLMWAIINAVGDNYFRSVGPEIGLKEYADALMHLYPKEAEELLAVIGDNGVKLGQNLQRLEGVEFWGYRLVKILKRNGMPKKEKNIVLWQVQKRLKIPTYPSA